MASYRLAVRRDTAANWTSADPILAQGEFGYEHDTSLLKIGDGVTAWTLLDYYDPNPALGTGGSLVGDFRFTNSTTDASGGRFGVNSATPASITQLNISVVSNNDFVWTGNADRILPLGSEFIALQKNDSTRWVHVQIDSAFTDNSSYYTYDVTFVAVGPGGLPSDGKDCLIEIIQPVYAELDLLDDVDTSTTPPSLNDVLKYDGAQWVPALDVTYTDQEVSNHLNVGTATPLQILQWTGADFDWVDSATLTGVVDINDLGDVDTTGVVGGDVLKWSGSAWTPTTDDDTDALADLTDTVITTPANGEVLSYNGANWVNATAPAGYTDADVDTHLNTGTATANQVLEWDGADYAWVDQSGGGGAPAGPNPTVLLKGDVAVDQDDSTNGYTFTTTGTPTLDTGDKQFGASSISFPTTSKITTNETINIGTGSWCLEGWFKPTSVAVTDYWASKPPTGGNMWFYTTNGVPYAFWNNAGRAMTSSLSTSAWNHIAWVYDAGNTTLKGYFNGVEEFTTTAAAIALSDAVWAFGGTDNGIASSSQWYNGLIDDLRFTTGDPVYTGAFTPAEHPIPVANPLGTDETDVTITSPANGEVLTYNGSNWVNSSGFDGSANKVVLGTHDLGPDAGATTSIAIGSSQYWYAGNTGIMIGYDTQNFGTGNIVIGNSTKLQPSATNAVCIGNNAGNGLGSLTSSVLIGQNAGNGGAAVLHSNAIIVNSTGSNNQVANAGGVVLETTKAKMEYSDANGWEFTEDIGGTPVTYDLSSLGGGGGLQNDSVGTNGLVINPVGTANADNNTVLIGHSVEGSADSVTVGYDAGNNSSSRCVSIGYQAADGSTGINNVSIGYKSNYFGGAAAYNVNIGYEAGSVIPGTGAVNIGRQSGANSGGDYCVNLGYFANTTSQLDNTILIKSDGTTALNQTEAGQITIKSSTATIEWTSGSGFELTEGASTARIDPAAGVYNFPNLPTADPVVAGQLWNDAGTLKVSAG